MERGPWIIQVSPYVIIWLCKCRPFLSCGQRETGLWNYAQRDTTLPALKREEGGYKSRTVGGC